MTPCHEPFEYPQRTKPQRPPKNEFRALLEDIIYTDRTSAQSRKITNKLRVAPQKLGQIIYDGKPISQENMSHWATVFEELCKDKWNAPREGQGKTRAQEYGDLFEKSPKYVANHRGPSSTEPSSKDSIGHTIWKIIGGPNAQIAFVAEKLEGNVSLKQFSGILHGTAITQEWLAKRNMEGVLEKYYSAAWNDSEDEYKARLAALPRSSEDFRFSSTYQPRRTQSMDDNVHDRRQRQNAPTVTK